MILPPIEKKEELFNFFKNAETSQANYRIGTEHEVFLFDAKSLKRATADQIQILLDQWSKIEGIPVKEGKNTVGLKIEDRTLSLEPGGQFELSGAPLENLHETFKEIEGHQKTLLHLANGLGLLVLPLGADPFTQLADRSWMRKERYKIMRPYMATKGALGHEMMTGSCTVQVNLDFKSERDMIRKMRIGIALQPLATALFANSPLSKGGINGYQSIRRAFWEETDPDRCGLLDFVFEDTFGYERYIEYAINVPLYFVRRKGRYLNVAGIPFKTFLEGNLEALPGEKPTLQDWDDHLTTIFTEARLKRFIEMRGADSGSTPQLMSLPGFWTGLLYDDTILQRIYDLIQTWQVREIKDLSSQVARKGLYASFQGESLWDLAYEVVSLSQEGLRSRNREEEVYLQPLFDMLDSKKSFADQTLEAFRKAQNPSTFIKNIL